MFNNHLATEEAKLKIQQREQEAETYRLQKQLGYGDPRAVRWIFALILLMTAVGLLLF